MALSLMQAIMFEKHCLIESGDNDNNWAYYAAYLLDKFGIVVNEPKKLTPFLLAVVSDYMHARVPKSFYSNPQDTKYYGRDELFLNQALAYFLKYGEEDSSLDIFRPWLPEYKVGDELVLRHFDIITPAEAELIAADYAAELADYKRPWSVKEATYMDYLLANRIINPREFACRDNTMLLVSKYPWFTRNLDWKDAVKASIKAVGEHADIAESLCYIRKQLHTPESAAATTLRTIMDNAHLLRPVSMSKRQAKYYKKLCQVWGIRPPHFPKSPYAEAFAEFKRGGCVAAAKAFAKHGSLLERHLQMLISRATIEEANEILDLVNGNNPVALYQLVSGMTPSEGTPRTFTFTKNRRVKHHVETAYETKYRRSNLSQEMISMLIEACTHKIEEYYNEKTESLGKCFIGKEFDSVALPINTSATGTGLDVLPVGSRMPIQQRFIRSFVTWQNVSDIDFATILVREEGAGEVYSYWNYHKAPKFMQFSGDITSPSGTEYWDFDLIEAKNAGYRWIVFNMQGFCDNLNIGTIETGYQEKSDLNTAAWDPKNNKFKFTVKGDSRTALLYAIDLQSMEVIVLNQVMENFFERNADPEFLKPIMKYLTGNILAFPMSFLVATRAEDLVADPTEADWVFSSDYQGTEGVEQNIVRPWNISTLNKLLN